MGLGRGDPTHPSAPGGCCPEGYGPCQPALSSDPKPLGTSGHITSVVVSGLHGRPLASAGRPALGLSTESTRRGPHSPPLAPRGAVFGSPCLGWTPAGPRAQRRTAFPGTGPS